MVYEKREIDGVEVPPLRSRDREGRVCGRACVRNSSRSLPPSAPVNHQDLGTGQNGMERKGKEEGDKKGLWVANRSPKVYIKYPGGNCSANTKPSKVLNFGEMRECIRYNGTLTAGVKGNGNSDPSESRVTSSAWHSSRSASHSALAHRKATASPKSPNDARRRMLFLWDTLNNNDKY